MSELEDCVAGYSQGAQVAGDVMCGTSEAGFNATQPLEAGLAKHGIYVLAPSYVPLQIFDFLSPSRPFCLHVVLQS